MPLLRSNRHRSNKLRSQLSLKTGHKNGWTLLRITTQWRRQGGGGGKLPPYGWTSKNYVIRVCFHCRGTSSYHTTNTKPYKFPTHCSKCLSFWGTSYSRPPIDPYLTSPPLQNPGGAIVTTHTLSAMLRRTTDQKRNK